MKRLIAAMILALVPAAPAVAAKTETAVLAGGCFWGMEAVFERVRGVRDVVSGFAGDGPATYAAVASGRAPHAEAVRITYDPDEVGFTDLLHIYFTVAHDPTQLNRQGPDVGAGYRSAIFPQDAAQRRAAAAFVAALEKRGSFRRPIVTRLESGGFTPAGAEHQDFMRRNPRHPYILAHDVPKVGALKRLYPARYRD